MKCFWNAAETDQVHTAQSNMHVRFKLHHYKTTGILTLSLAPLGEIKDGTEQVL